MTAVRKSNVKKLNRTRLFDRCELALTVRTGEARREIPFWGDFPARPNIEAMIVR
jgi:hypothetical protein